MVANILAIEEIVSDPKVRGGRPVIRGTGITVANVVLAHTTTDKQTFEQIAVSYGLDLAQVHAAMAYYYRHQDDLNAEIQRDADEARRLLEELEKQGKAKPMLIDPE